MNSRVEQISRFIDAAQRLGLHESDAHNAKDLLLHNEHGLAFDTIITQLHEYEIEIDRAFFRLAQDIAQTIGVSENAYSFIKELIR